MLIFNVEISYSISYYEISILRKNTGNITGNEENNTMELHITCIPGDGIGPEIVRETKKVLDKVAHKYGHKMIYKDILMGGACIDVHGVPLTEEAIADAKAADAVLMGSIGGNTTTSPWSHHFPLVQITSREAPGSRTSGNAQGVESVC